MAYRRRQQGISRKSSFKAVEQQHGNSFSSSLLAEKAMRESLAHNYGDSALSTGGNRNSNTAVNQTTGLVETDKRITNKSVPADLHKQEKDSSTGAGKWSQMHSQNQTDAELQLKASRDVAMAMAAKGKLILRELKTSKADLSFAKERCTQLEEENKTLRENRSRKSHLDDDEMIWLQLETLLAKKARLAHENSVYARENRFLREVVEYHQLKMQDVYVDDDTEEASEAHLIRVPPSPL